MISISKAQTGFTLVELLVSMAVAGIVMAAVYSSYYSQQKAYVTQEQVAQMQQNLRAALYHLERDIRMAGYDPTGKAKAKILTAGANSIQFTKDDNNNTNTRDPDGDLADPNENITYTLGTLDGVKRITLNGQPVAENIDGLNLVYLDETGGAPANINAIRSVQISIVARTARQDPGYTDTSTYTNLQGTTFYTPPANELKFRRGMLRTEIRCRNLGL